MTPPLDPEDDKRIKDLGTAIASLQTELTTLKTSPAAKPEDVARLDSGLSELKSQLSKLTPAAPGAGAPEESWTGFLGRLLNPMGL